MSQIFSSSPSVQSPFRPTSNGGGQSSGAYANLFRPSGGSAQGASSLGGATMGGASNPAMSAIEEYITRAVMQIVERVLTSVISKLDSSMGLSSSGPSAAAGGTAGAAGADMGIGNLLEGILGELLSGSSTETAASGDTNASEKSSGGGLFDGILGSFSGLFSKAKDGFGSILDTVGGLFTKAKDGFGGILGSIGSYASSFFSGAGSWLSGIGSFFGF